MQRDLSHVFVGGPIQHAILSDGTFDAGTKRLIELLLAGLEGRGYRVLSAHRYERFGELDVANKFQDVCARDYQWMRRCDMFVAVLPLDETGAVIFSGGTAVELGWASAMGKPILLVCDPAPKYSHLIIGLDAVARVAKLDVNREDIITAVCDTVDLMLEGQVTLKLADAGV